MDSKERSRKGILNKRRELSRQAIIKKSQQISDSLTQTDFFQKAKYILFYSSFDNEVVTDALITEAIKEGKNVFLPCMNAEEKSFSIRRVTSLHELETNKVGIREPLVCLPEHCLTSIELIIVPGVVFDEDGFRIGYGGGYYDRMLSGLDGRVLKAALAYEFQVVENIKKEEHDQKMDYLITEEKIRKF